MSFTAHAGNYKQYEVSITNATAHQVFTPTLIVTHKSKISLFQVGSPASDGLAHQAENGDPSAKLAETQGLNGVYDTLIGDFIPGGVTSSFVITAPKKAHISLTAMLATTNDSFVALTMYHYRKDRQLFTHVFMMPVPKPITKTALLFSGHPVLEIPVMQERLKAPKVL
jgi:hypothetical protein